MFSVYSGFNRLKSHQKLRSIYTWSLRISKSLKPCNTEWTYKALTVLFSPKPFLDMSYFLMAKGNPPENTPEVTRVTNQRDHISDGKKERERENSF